MPAASETSPLSRRRDAFQAASRSHWLALHGSVLGRLQSISIFAVEQRFVLALRQRLYQAIANADWLFLCRSRSTDFTQALTEEADRVGEATYVVLMLAADTIVP